MAARLLRADRADAGRGLPERRGRVVGAPVTYTVGGHDTQFAMALAVGDFNGDGVTDIAVATTLAVNVLLSMCE